MDAGVGPPVTVVAAGNVGPYEYEVIQLPHGEQVRGVGVSWPYAAGVDLPAMRKATQLATAGNGVVMLDQSPLIDEHLAIDRAVSLRPSRDTCQAGCPSGGQAGVGSLALVSLALVARRRRPLR